MKQQIRDRGRSVVTKVSPAFADRITARRSSAQDRRLTKAQLATLEDRVNELEVEMQENRRLSRRVAELTDIVQELLVPIAQRDEDKVREHIERYSASL